MPRPSHRPASIRPNPAPTGSGPSTAGSPSRLTPLGSSCLLGAGRQGQQALDRPRTGQGDRTPNPSRRLQRARQRPCPATGRSCRSRCCGSTSTRGPSPAWWPPTRTGRSPCPSGPYWRRSPSWWMGPWSSPCSTSAIGPARSWGGGASAAAAWVLPNCSRASIRAPPARTTLP